MATSIPTPCQAGCWAPGRLQTPPHHTRRYPDRRLVLHISHLKKQELSTRASQGRTVHQENRLLPVVAALGPL